eukprot:529999_1
MTIDFIGYTGLWSSFKLFYQFRPLQLLSYTSIFVRHNKSHLESTNENKAQKFNDIQIRLHKEIQKSPQFMTYDVEKMKTQCQQLKEHIQHLEQQSSSKIDRKKMDIYLNRMAKVGSLMIILLVCSSLLAVGMLALVLKVSQLAFMHQRELIHWKFAEYFYLFAFCNQLWGMTDVNRIEINSIYKFLFVESKKKVTRYISQHVSIMDDVIKSQLCKKYGWRGLLLGLSFDSKLLQNIIVKDYDAFSVEDLLKYKFSLMEEHEYDKINQKIQNQNDFQDNAVVEIRNNDSSPLLSKEKAKPGKVQRFQMLKQGIQSKINKYLDILTLKAKQEPIHPYFEALSTIKRYKRKLCVTSDEFKWYLIAKKMLLLQYNNTETPITIHQILPMENVEHKKSLSGNYLMDHASFYEAILWLVDRSHVWIWIFVSSLCTLFALLSVIFESDQSVDLHCGGNLSYNSINIVIVIGWFGLATLYMLTVYSCCESNHDHACIGGVYIVSLFVVVVGFIYQIIGFWCILFQIPDQVLELTMQKHWILVASMFVTVFNISLGIIYTITFIIANVIFVTACIVWISWFLALCFPLGRVFGLPISLVIALLNIVCIEQNKKLNFVYFGSILIFVTCVMEIISASVWVIMRNCPSCNIKPWTKRLLLLVRYFDLIVNLMVLISYRFVMNGGNTACSIGWHEGWFVFWAYSDWIATIVIYWCFKIGVTKHPLSLIDTVSLPYADFQLSFWN